VDAFTDDGPRSSPIALVRLLQGRYDDALEVLAVDRSDPA
jgi:hypothetical protein